MSQDWEMCLCIYDIRVIDCMLANAKWQGDTSGKGAREDSGQMGGDEVLPFKAAPNFQRQQRLRRGQVGCGQKLPPLGPKRSNRPAPRGPTPCIGPQNCSSVWYLRAYPLSHQWREFQGSLFGCLEKVKNLWLSLGGGCTEERGAWKGIINVIETKSAVTQSLFAN